jgi:hypothetical protein
MSEEITPDPEWDAPMARYREDVESDPSLHRVPTLVAHLERIRLTHQNLLDARARLEPSLLSLPVVVLLDLPIERGSADRFTGLAIDARTMGDRWEELAHEYDGLAKSIRDLSDEDHR